MFPQMLIMHTFKRILQSQTHKQDKRLGQIQAAKNNSTKRGEESPRPICRQHHICRHEEQYQTVLVLPEE